MRHTTVPCVCALFGAPPERTFRYDRRRSEDSNLLRTIEQGFEELPGFILGRAKEIELQERRLRGELDALARAGQDSAEAALAKVRGRVEGLRKLLTAPVAQARSALRRLGVTVTLERPK